MNYPSLTQLNYYETYNAISQSRLRSMFDTRKGGSTAPMLYGSYVDCLLTLPHLVNELFVVTDVSTPPDNIQAIFQDLKGEFESNTDLMVEKARAINYHSNYKDATLIDKFRDHKEYYDLLQDSTGKKIVTSEVHESASMLANVVKNAANTSYFFEEAKNKEIFFQYPLYFQLQGLECKGLADEIVINHHKETITIIDFKFTTLPVKQWGLTAENYGYPMQFSFYKEGVLQMFKDYTHYKIDCKWVVVNENSAAPWVITCDDHFLYKFKFGFRDDNNRRVYGWKELLDIYKECDEQFIDPANYFWHKYLGSVNLLTLNND